MSDQRSLSDSRARQQALSRTPLGGTVSIFRWLFRHSSFRSVAAAARFSLSCWNCIATPAYSHDGLLCTLQAAFTTSMNASTSGVTPYLDWPFSLLGETFRFL